MANKDGKSNLPFGFGCSLASVYYQKYRKPEDAWKDKQILCIAAKRLQEKNMMDKT